MGFLSQFIARAGGRKFAAWVGTSVGLVVAGATGHDLPPEILSSIETLFLVYVGGNAAEHIGRGLAERRTTMAQAIAAEKEKGGAKAQEGSE